MAEMRVTLTANSVGGVRNFLWAPIVATHLIPLLDALEAPSAPRKAMVNAPNRVRFENSIKHAITQSHKITEPALVTHEVKVSKPTVVTIAKPVIAKSTPALMEIGHHSQVPTALLTSPSDKGPCRPPLHYVPLHDQPGYFKLVGSSGVPVLYTRGTSTKNGLMLPVGGNSPLSDVDPDIRKQKMDSAVSTTTITLQISFSQAKTQKY
ncbi:hypothetical protein EJ08DRAFT_695317 [Tothia fuscella]|uniref:Uncharacterized protein n=1 Tax=Tothia fuscella TaxID=1048955 RepID=A0A9P4NVT8_9PEZI|nr:hypothetical protein EJ08DRAFT_695317 [Tothia fuscella]